MGRERKYHPHPIYEQQSLTFGEHTITPRRIITFDELGDLHRALHRFIDVRKLRQVASLSPENLHIALKSDNPPQAVRDLVDTLRAVLCPINREQIRSSADAASLLMVEMAYLDQEQMRTILLDTRNRIHSIVTVYKGSLNQSTIRVGELYKEALRYNSASIIVAHNHPSGDPVPSPEDILITQRIVEAGELLDVECLDHLVIGQGRWVSMRRLNLGFP